MEGGAICLNASHRAVPRVGRALLTTIFLVVLLRLQSTCAFQAATTARKASLTRSTNSNASLRAFKVNEQEDGLANGSRVKGVKSSNNDKLDSQQAPQKGATAFFFADKSSSKGNSKSAMAFSAKNPTTLMSVENDIASPLVDIDQGDKFFMLGLLWITACLSALDRVAMSVALVPMTDEFGLTDTIKGSISSFFSVGYGLGILPAGILLSFASPRVIMSVAVVSWSVATLATPWAAQQGLALGSTASILLLARASVGAAESLVMPTLQRLLLSWTTPEEKALGVATVITGFQAGTIAAYLLSPAVMDVFGGDAWRELFYVYGAFGMALLLPWLFLAKDSPVVMDELAFSATKNTGSTRTSPKNLQDAIQVFKDAPWAAFAKSKGAWAMLLAHCSKNWGLYNSLAWTPTFYAEQYGIGVRDSAWLSVLPSVAGAVGGLLAGNLADAVLRRQQEANGGEIEQDQLTNIRKTFQGIALYGPAVALGALAWEIPEDPVIAQSFLMAAVGLQAFTAAGFDAGNQEKAGPRWAGLLYSVTSLPAVMFGTFGVYCVGQVLDATGQDWSLVWGVNAAVNVLGATAFIALYNSKREFD